MSRAALLLLPLLLAVSASATIQRPDSLLVGTSKRDVHGIELAKDALFRLDAWKKKNKSEGVSSDNWKGFYATLRLANDDLILEAISVDNADGLSTTPVPLRYLFGADRPVRALWFSGELIAYRIAPGVHKRAALPPYRREKYKFRTGKLVSFREHIMP